MKKEEVSRQLPGLPSLFQYTTSLGGLESQIEWRKLVETSASPTPFRISVEVENLDDLKADLL